MGFPAIMVGRRARAEILGMSSIFLHFFANFLLDSPGELCSEILHQAIVQGTKPDDDIRYHRINHIASC